jgi:hypothetical protein
LEHHQLPLSPGSYARSLAAITENLIRAGDFLLEKLIEATGSNATAFWI